MFKKLLMVAAVIALCSAPAQAELVYGVTDSGSLRSFDSATPGTQNTVGNVTGLLGGHTIRGIDFRPNGGALYAISTDASGGTAQMYTVNLATAMATPQGSSFALTGNTSTRVSMDFNPQADRLRIVTGDTVENNFRWNPVSNAFVAADGTLRYAAGDPNEAATPLVAAVAYDNNFNGTTTTTLFAYVYLIDDVSTIGNVAGNPNSPNTGLMFTVGDSGVVAGLASLGFDISGATGVGYLNIDTTGSNDDFYTINLGTGAVSPVGSLGTPWLDISVVPEPTTLTLVGLAGLALLRRRR